MKNIAILVITFLFFVSSASLSFAHVLKTDGSVGAVIHVSPEDDPIARETTDFFFEFKDKKGRFKPDNCDCQGIILQKGKEIYSAPLFQNSANPSLEDASFSFTFPEKDIYKVRVSGKPIAPDAFQSFALEWDIRVARESETAPAAGAIQDVPINRQSSFLNWVSRHIPHIIGAFLILVAIGYYIIRQKIRKVKKE